MAAIGALGGVSSYVPGVQGVTAAAGPGALTGTAKTSGDGFAATLVGSLEQVQQLHSTAAGLGVKAATGDLTDVHDYTIASTQARVATEVTVAVRNKALEAFNDIMRMQV